MSVFFSVQAEADLECIADYIAADSPARALSFVSEVASTATKSSTKGGRRIGFA
jgi:plasmid stabilization system protein ParE